MTDTPEPAKPPPTSDAGRSFSSPPGWAFERTNWTVSIVPRTTPLIVQTALLLGIVLLGVVIGLLAHVTIIMFLALLLGVMLWGSLKLLDTINTRRGPWFVFRVADGIVELPRLKVTVARTERKEFELVAPGEDDPARGIELNLLVRSPGGGAAQRWPLVGGAASHRPGGSEIERLAEALSSATAIPIRRTLASEPQKAQGFPVT